MRVLGNLYVFYNEIPEHLLMLLLIKNNNHVKKKVCFVFVFRCYIVVLRKRAGVFQRLKMLRRYHHHSCMIFTSSSINCLSSSFYLVNVGSRTFSLPGQRPNATNTSVKNFSPAERREQMRLEKEQRDREIKRKVDDYKRKYHPNAREVFFGLVAVSAIFFSLFIGGGCMLPKSTGFFQDPGDRE